MKKNNFISHSYSGSIIYSFLAPNSYERNDSNTYNYI